MAGGRYHGHADKAAHHRRQITAGRAANPSRVTTIAEVPTSLDPWAAFKPKKRKPIPFRIAQG